MKESSDGTQGNAPLKAIVPIMVIIGCILLAVLLIKLKPEVETREPKEAVYLTELITAAPQDVTVTLTTHGVARPVRSVTLSSEVAGRIIRLDSRLEPGDLVNAGQRLITVDPADYEDAVNEAKASLARLEASLERLTTTEKTTRAQLEVSRRSRDLALADFERLTKLSQEENTVSQAVAEASERTLAQAESQVLQLEQTLALLPSQRAETESERIAAETRLNRAATQLKRTRVEAPFNGRVIASMVEEDSYLAPGSPLVELADDRVLELQVSLLAGDLRTWLQFTSGDSHSGWFPPVKQVPVAIEWTGSDQGHQWEGTLDRILSFDATTRMATLAVTVSQDQLVSKGTSFPLTDGMFCRVAIPGKTLQQVIALPREAVTFDNKAYISENGRLRTIDVTVAWSTKDTVYVSGGIEPGMQVVGTRLVAPMEGVKLQATSDDA